MTAIYKKRGVTLKTGALGSILSLFLSLEQVNLSLYLLDNTGLKQSVPFFTPLSETLFGVLPSGFFAFFKLE
jgi:hypothetical protein